MKFPKIQWFKAKLDPEPNEAAVATQQTAGTFDAKRWIVLGSLVGLLVLAGFMNWRLNDASTDPGASNVAKKNTLEDWEKADLEAAKQSDVAADPATSDVAADAQTDPVVITTLAAFATERDRTRADAIAQLDSIIQTSKDDEMVQEAEKQKLEMAKSMDAEVTLQGLLVAKGFDGAVVTVHTGSVNVVVEAEKLTEAQIARITDMAMRETGEPAGSIHVMTSKATK